MRIAIRIFLLLIFGAAFVGAVVLSYRGSAEYVSIRVALPKLFGQKSQGTLRFDASAGQYQAVIVRSAVHNGTTWIDYAPDANWVSANASPASYFLGSAMGEGFRFGDFGVGHRKLDRRIWWRVNSVDDYTLSRDQLAFIAPWWFVMLVTGLTAGYLAMTFRRHQLPQTQCRTCGYDLRAGHGKCPECGADSHVGSGASNVTDAITAPSGQR